jgi:Flp pilus assembly pilin Flp
MEDGGMSAYCQATMRDERGQTAAEYLGVLLLIGVIVAAVLGAGTGTAVAGGLKHAVCAILQQDDCDTGAPGAPPPGVGDSDLDGPSLTDHPLPVLPFPGSVTVSCTYDERDPRTCVPHGGPGVSVQASGELKVERTPTSLDANGCPWQNLSVQAKLQLSANAEAKGAKAGGSLSGYLGRSTAFQVTVAPDQADAIADGDRPPPNPVDPTTLRAGESVQLTEDFYKGVSAKGSYRALQLELGYDEGHRVSSGVKRISPTTVRVLVGDSDFVRNALKLGVGYKDVAVSLGNSKDLADGKLHGVDIDISNPAGWEAYQAFLASGQLPPEGTPGTLNPTKAETVVYTDVTQIEAKLGGLKLGGRLNDSEGRFTETHNADGTTDTTGFARYGNVGVAVTTKKDAGGDVVGTPTRSLLLEDVDPSLVGALYTATGKTPPQDPGRNVRLDFTEGQLEQLRQAALSRLADKIELNRDGRPSNAEIARSLQENHGVIEYKGVQYGFTGLDVFLGMAETPEDALIALYHGGMSSGAVAENLAGLMLDGDLHLDTINQPQC